MLGLLKVYRMASAIKYAKHDSVVDEVMSTVKRSFFGKPVDDKFFNCLESLIEIKMAATGHSTLFNIQSVFENITF